METKRLQMQQQDDETEIDLGEIFYMLLHKAWIIILAAVVCAAGAGVFTKTMITPQFQSSSMLFILTKTTTITSLADIQMGTQLTKDYSVLIKSRPVLEEVIKELGLNMRYEQLAQKVKTTNQPDTRILNIIVTDSDPQMAKKITDKIADVSVSRIADIMKTDEPSIVDYGNEPEFKSSPNTMKNCAVSGLAGAAAAAFILILLFIMNDSLKNAEDIEKHLGLATLGTIPCTNAEKKQKRRFKRRSKTKKR